MLAAGHILCKRFTEVILDVVGIMFEQSADKKKTKIKK